MNELLSAILAALAISPFAIVYASFFEWALHRYLMHHPFLGFRYPYERHHEIHHRIFRADHTYHLINEEDKRTIPMAWWNAVVLVPLATLPFLGVGFWFYHPIGVTLGAGLTILAYYGVYEYIHWCMHLPRPQRLVERSPVFGHVFFRLNGHHLLHHRNMGTNYNVVCPFADLVLCTFVKRAKIHFKQATGPSIPNVQPKTPRSVVLPSVV